MPYRDRYVNPNTQTQAARRNRRVKTDREIAVEQAGMDRATKLANTLIGAGRGVPQDILDRTRGGASPEEQKQAKQQAKLLAQQRRILLGKKQRAQQAQRRAETGNTGYARIVGGDNKVVEIHGGDLDRNVAKTPEQMERLINLYEVGESRRRKPVVGLSEARRILTEERHPRKEQALGEIEQFVQDRYAAGGSPRQALEDFREDPDFVEAVQRKLDRYVGVRGVDQAGEQLGGAFEDQPIRDTPYFTRETEAFGADLGGQRSISANTFRGRRARNAAVVQTAAREMVERGMTSEQIRNAIDPEDIPLIEGIIPLPQEEFGRQIEGFDRELSGLRPPARPADAIPEKTDLDAAMRRQLGMRELILTDKQIGKIDREEAAAAAADKFLPITNTITAAIESKAITVPDRATSLGGYTATEATDTLIENVGGITRAMAPEEKKAFFDYMKNTPMVAEITKQYYDAVDMSNSLVLNKAKFFEHARSLDILYHILTGVSLAPASTYRE